MDVITSSQNNLIKEIKSLDKRKYRDEKGLFIAEGIRFVGEALEESADISYIVVSEKLPDIKGGIEILKDIEAQGIKYYRTTEKIFKDISNTESPQGILAVIKAKKLDFEDIVQEHNKIIILEGLQDPGNMGTIIRTADAAGMTGIIISEGCVDIYNPKVLRSTMGSVFHLPVYQCKDIVNTLKLIKTRGIKIYATHLKGNQSCHDLKMDGDVAIIIGNEANGINDETAGLADVLVRIPMPGKAESLNASVAAGILMYEVVRTGRY